MNEKQVERRLVSQVDLRCGMCVKLTSLAGLPDRLVLLPGGRLWFVELKSPTGECSRLQLLRIRTLQNLGFRAIVLWSVSEVDSFFERIDRGEAF